MELVGFSKGLGSRGTTFKRAGPSPEEGRGRRTGEQDFPADRRALGIEGRDAVGIFDRYAPFVQEFIFQHDWQSLRGIQVAAGEAIFDTDENVLLTASTASGKTEAAFFPILTEFWENPPRSVGALYIGPLKALINDQFYRLNDLCAEADIPIWHWHGDVSASHKAKLLKKPSGILQITPESLEALLMHKHAVISKLFCDLRYIVIDEVHSLLRGDRGGQALCLIERLSRMAGTSPRRIGLSATLGRPEAVGAFLSAGTGRDCIIPRVEEPGRIWRLSMEHFYIGASANASNEATFDSGGMILPQVVSHARGGDARAGVPAGAGEVASGSAVSDTKAQSASGAVAMGASGAGCVRGSSSDEESTVIKPSVMDADPADIATVAPFDAPTDQAPKNADPGLGYIFEHTRGRKCLVFANSREEAEGVCTSLRSYCEARHEPDRFLIHHGNLSASIRESAEEIMRDEGEVRSIVTTATLELGIDIGRMERAFQIDAPFTVSAFLQRMGRTGRRGTPPEMWFVMREEKAEPRSLLPETLPWKLLQGIALVQLYREERWVEPPRLDRLPYSLLYHQTMATLASEGEMTPARLASKVLSLTFFHRVSQDDFRTLLLHLLEMDHIERTEAGGLIAGLAGERVVNSFKFYAVFQENEEYTVRSDSQEIGTIVKPPPPGEKIAIAGHVWVVEEVDHKRRVLYCTQVKGRVPAYFGDCPGDINTKILERMKRVLEEDCAYPYVMDHAQVRLAEARHVAKAAGVVSGTTACGSSKCVGLQTAFAAGTNEEEGSAAVCGLSAESEDPARLMARSADGTDRTVEPTLINLGGNMWCLMPWLGSYAFLALERLLIIKCAPSLGLRGLNASRPYFMTFIMDESVDEQAFRAVVAKEAAELRDPLELVYPGEVPRFEKYDEFVPDELVRKGFAYGVLDVNGMRERMTAGIETPRLKESSF